MEKEYLIYGHPGRQIHTKFFKAYGDHYRSHPSLNENPVNGCVVDHLTWPHYQGPTISTLRWSGHNFQIWRAVKTPNMSEMQAAKYDSG